MNHRIVSAQLAEYAQEHGGGSFHFHSGRPVQGPGFMVADDGAETKVAGASPTSEEIQSFADEHGPRVKEDERAALGVWGKVMDVSKKVASGQEMRREARANRQEAAYALGSASGGPTRINSSMNTDSINRPYGADVLTNLSAASDARGDRVFLDLSRNESDNVRPHRERLFGRSEAANDISLNEIENDSWSMTNRNNKRGASGRGPNSRTDGSKKRIDLGDVYRTINSRRTKAARGINMTAHPTKGWHEDTNERKEKVGPSKIRVNPDDGVRSTVQHSAALEAERQGFPHQQSPEEWAEQQYAAAAELHRRLSPPRTTT